MSEKNVSLSPLALDTDQLAMLELLLSGYCEPLAGYMDRQEAASVLASMRLPDGRAWPFPVVLAVPATKLVAPVLGERLVLTDAEGAPLAALTVREVWRAADLPDTLRVRYGARMGGEDSFFLAGRVENLARPTHYDFPELRLGAEALRQRCAAIAGARILAGQPDDLLHKTDLEQISCVARQWCARILIMAPVRNEQMLSPTHYVRVRCLQHALRRLAPAEPILSLWPQPWLDPLPEGREVLWRAFLARTAGATDLIVEPEWWRGVGEGEKDAVRVLTREIGINLVEEPALQSKPPVASPAEAGKRGGALTAAIIQRLRAGEPIPEEATYPEILEEIRQSHLVKERQGVTIFFTGLSGAGKSTIARVLLAKLLEMGNRAVTFLDGDIVRRHLSSELGFSRAHRDINILRIGFVASEITKHGGIAICAPIAPYRETRRKVRQMIEAYGGFFEVYVATPLDVCEARDRKGLYAKARAGLIKEFTGISDPYETPERAEIIIDTRAYSPLEAAQVIIARIREAGFIR